MSEVTDKLIETLNKVVVRNQLKNPQRLGIVKYAMYHRGVRKLLANFMKSIIPFPSDEVKRLLDLPTDTTLIAISPHQFFTENALAVKVTHPSLPVLVPEGDEPAIIPTVVPIWKENPPELKGLRRFSHWKIEKRGG